MKTVIKRPKKVKLIEAEKYERRQKLNMSSNVRLLILNRAIPELINHFGDGKCTLYDDFKIPCTKCPLRTEVNGIHCDIRAVLALLIDDLEKENRSRLPHVAQDIFKYQDEDYNGNLDIPMKEHSPNRFDGII